MASSTPLPDLEKLGKELKSFVLSAKSCDLATLQRDYKALNGKDIPYRQHGYSSLEQLINAVPKYVRMRNRMVEAVSTQSSAHLESLIYRTKSKAKTPASLVPNQQPKRGAVSRSGRGGGMIGMRGRGGFIPSGPPRAPFVGPPPYAFYPPALYGMPRQPMNGPQSIGFGGTRGPPTMAVHPMQQLPPQPLMRPQFAPQQPLMQQPLPPRMQPLATSETTNAPVLTSLNEDQKLMKKRLLVMLAAYDQISFQELQNAYKARFNCAMPGDTFPCGAKTMFVEYFKDDVQLSLGPKQGQFWVRLKQKQPPLKTSTYTNSRSPLANSLLSRSVGVGSDGIPCVIVPNSVSQSSLNPAATPYIATNAEASTSSFKINTVPSANQVTQQVAAVRSVPRVNELRTNVLGLLKERYPHGVRLEVFSDEYNQRYGCWLSPTDYGYVTWLQTLTLLVGSNYLHISDDRVSLNYDGAVSMGIRPPVVPDTPTPTPVAAAASSTSEQLSSETSQTTMIPSEADKHKFKQTVREILLENRSGITSKDLAARFREVAGAPIESYGYQKKDLVTVMREQFVEEGIVKIDVVPSPTRILFVPTDKLLSNSRTDDELVEVVLANISKSGSEGIPLTTVQELIGVPFEEALDFVAVKHKHEFRIQPETDSSEPVPRLMVNKAIEPLPVSSDASGGCTDLDELAPLTVFIPMQRLPNTDRLAEFADDDFEHRFALITISHFVSPNEFYLHSLAEGCKDELEELEADMLTYYDTVVDLELLGEKAQPGIFCVCFWSAKFHRCRVLNRNPEADGGVVCLLVFWVHLIDSGETVSVASSDLGPLLTRFCQLPSQAIPAAFNDLYPIGQEWDIVRVKNVCEALMSSSGDGKLWAYVNDIDDQGRALVDLYVTIDDEEGVFFSAAIREAQLAAPLTDDYNIEDAQQFNALPVVDGAGDGGLDLEDQLADVVVISEETDDDLVFDEIERKRQTNPEEARELAADVLKITSVLKARAAHDIENAVGPELGAKWAELQKFEIRLVRLRELINDGPPEDPR